MKKIAFAAIFTFCFAVLFANDGNKHNKAESGATIKIEGKIVDKYTNEALAGVALELNSGSKKYYTDFEGNFLIEGIQPGVYKIDVIYVSYQGITLEEINTNDTELKLKVELESISH